MSDQWMIRGTQFANCNCAWGCPCQFNSPTTHGHCEAIEAGHIEEGNYNGTRLDGLNYAMLVQWPGEIADGNGREQFIIDERADEAQRVALEKILRGESTEPGATHFYVFNSTMSEVLDSIFAPIDMEIDVTGRTARIEIPGVGASSAQPIIEVFRKMRRQLAPQQGETRTTWLQVLLIDDVAIVGVIVALRS